MDVTSDTQDSKPQKSARRTSMAFDNIDTRDMAHTLAYLDFKLFRRISVSMYVFSIYIFTLIYTIDLSHVVWGVFRICSQGEVD